MTKEKFKFYNFLNFKIKKLSIFTSFFFILRVIFSILLAVNVVILEFISINIWSKTKVNKLFENIPFFVYWIFFSFLLVSFISLIIYKRIKNKNKELLLKCYQGFYYLFESFKYKDIFLRENNLLEEFDNFQEQDYKTKTITFGFVKIFQKLTLIFFWNSIFGKLMFSFKTPSVPSLYYMFSSKNEYSSAYTPGYDRKRKNEYQEFLLNFDLQDERKICPNESFQEFMIKAGLQKECIEEFNKHQNFQDLINTEFFKLLDNQNFANKWASRIFTLQFSAILILIFNIIILFQLSEIQFHSGIFLGLSFAIWIFTSGLWSLIEWSIYVKNLAFFVMTNFNNLDLISDKVSEQNKKILEHFDNLSEKEKIKVYKIYQLTSLQRLLKNPYVSLLTFSTLFKYKVKD
ncbi:hypothetical protein [Mesomycoplasma hyorhinis]|uniref:ABC transporter ATP-binding protein n=1 Tax=Mesomycoplasma hyorhinis TaxID=2100 RepID=A0ABD6IEV1_MESHY|nr:hypothetical protein [Mesomycoplasma hyorhinis]MXR06840.1 hypothetical protein [Mesomycoplasma hyorhinis]MXR11906.1 hypothetical protein [Mesomycoplasma hyorhinis]MXR39087.1 hypothetical protein [Mesomycoplasma hyorhinis]MXR44019.1 hypothetical protein [Mesomycoplasma hyorhinis]MXR58328.1 hypothetical protein [Mesomycoplasma hyorhinis]